MKITQLCAGMFLSLCFIAGAKAAAHGPYVGLGLGRSALETPGGLVFNTSAAVYGENSSKHNVLGGRVFGGYRLNKHLGFEVGFTRYPNTTYSAVFNDLSSSIEYSMFALDAVGKVYLPLGESNFSIYALGGVAEVNSTIKYRNGGVPLAKGVVAPHDGARSRHVLRPKVGVGINYEVSSHLTAGIEYSRIQGLQGGAHHGEVPNANMVALSISYNFD